MNIEFEKQKDEKGIYYCANIEREDKTFLEIYLLVNEDKTTTIDYINLKALEDFNLLKEGLERLFSYSLKDNNNFSKFFIGDVVFGVDDRNNIILGEIVSFEDLINKSFNVKVRMMNNTYNIENQKGLKYSQVLNLKLDNFVHIEDKEGLKGIKEKRKEYQLEKLYFNRTEDHITKTNRNIDFLNKKIKNIEKYLDMLISKEKTEKREIEISELFKVKKQLENKRKNSFEKIDRETKLKEEIIEDKIFNNIYDYVCKMD